jgi:hypothetical protein
MTEWRQALAADYRRSRGPRWILDVDARDARIFPSAVGIRGYRLRGANIELYEPVLPLVVISS